MTEKPHYALSCCGHDAERHGPEAGGCIECRCRVTTQPYVPASDGWRVEYRVRCLSNPKHLPTTLPREQMALDLRATYIGGCGPHVIERRTIAVGAWEATPHGDQEPSS